MGIVSLQTNMDIEKISMCSPRGQALASRILEDTNLCPDWSWPRGFRALALHPRGSRPWPRPCGSWPWPRPWPLDFYLDTVYHNYSCKLQGLNL